MINKPSFWLAFKALAQIRAQIVNQLFERLCAFNAYYFLFYEKELVMNSVLYGLSAPDAEKVYSDEFYGMDSVPKLYIWVQANLMESGSDPYNQIIRYYKSIGITLDMNPIVGKQSMINMIVKTVHDNIAHEFDLLPTRRVDREGLFEMQWANNSVLSNPNIYLPLVNAPTLNSFKDLCDPESIQAYPEMHYYQNFILP
jgi:hypothetical protein